MAVLPSNHKNHLAPGLNHKLVLSHCSHELLLGQNLQTLSLCVTKFAMKGELTTAVSGRL